ncbi:alpha/beta fold hydrolase [Mesorhizobium microcysteis]|uniref:Alpha/beta fold hydrolase n=1 Tax=Neoaquamicrobium microcysteis TaxID=2682781 RepID=A0A5D4GNR7_9HYPH|nr:alpha/beta fold hydrolase [Mesorhizobium microcysteis]TYR29978.1 alpha/beta fold hydrolase [Mesorhizobium microcysteis]
MSLFVREVGDDGPIVVLLHGFGGSHAVWAPIQNTLATQARTLAYDLPGHAGSLGYPDAGSAKVAAQAILGELASRGIEKAHVAGHSMGGAVAALMAILDPARVASLTLLSPGGFGPEINHRLLTRYAAARDEASLRPCLEAMFGWMSPVPEETVAHALTARAGEGRSEKLMSMAQGLARDGKQGQLPRERLEALAMPVTVAWGELDNVLPSRQARALPWRFGVHLFADLGHMLPDEAPDEMAALIARTAGLGG